MWRPSERDIRAVVILSRWLIAPFLIGLLCAILLLIYRFFADLFALAIQVPSANWHDLIVGVLDLIDLALTANLVLIVVFSAYENYIGRVDAAEHPEWPPGLANVDFGALKLKLLGSIAGIAAVDALSWYLDLEKYSDTAKLSWALAFPLMFVVAMVMLALADWLGEHSKR